MLPIYDKDDQEEVPEEFTCPLTLEIMNDPVMTREGKNFERKAIIEWLNRGNTTCPLSRRPMSFGKLIPNAALRMRIEQWKRDHGIAVKDIEEKNNEDLKFMCLVDAPPRSLMEFEWNLRMIELSLGETPSALYSRNVRHADPETPRSRRRNIVGLLDSALSLVRRDRESNQSGL